MAEYIEKQSLIKFFDNIRQPKMPITEGFKFITVDSIIEYLSKQPHADVVERAEYERVLEIANFLSQQHGQKLDSIFELRSKIDKAIEEIENSFEPTIGTYDRETPEHDRPLQRFNRNEGKKLAIEIIKRNIGE